MSELRTNKILPRDGLPSGSFGGGIVQVRFAALDSGTTFSGTTRDILTLQITPTSASNKILLDLRVRPQAYYSSSDDSWHFGVSRTIGGGSKIWVSGKGKLGAGSSSNDLQHSYQYPLVAQLVPASFCHLYSVLVFQEDPHAIC